MSQTKLAGSIVPDSKVDLSDELVWIRKGPIPSSENTSGDSDPYSRYEPGESFGEKAWRKTMNNPIVPVGK